VTTLLSFIVVIGIIVFVHELGHFLAAKSCGMKVEIFSLGFGNKIFSKTYKETEYRIAWIPLGGYVKIAGMIDESMDPDFKGEDYEYESKNAFQKFFVLSAGVVMNFILAIIIYSVMIFIQGIAEIDSTYIGSVGEGYPAEKAGLLEGDKIISVDNIQIEKWEEISKIVHKKIEEPVLFELERDNTVIKKEIITVENETLIDDKIVKVGIIGIGPRVFYKEISVFTSIAEGAKLTWFWAKMGVVSIKMMITGEAGIKDLGGPIIVAKMSGDSARGGIKTFMSFIAFISINIGFLNLLPIPALDGGHLVYILIEGITRRKVKTSIKMRIQQIGILFLLTLMIFVIFNDINRVVNDDFGPSSSNKEEQVEGEDK